MNIYWVRSERRDEIISMADLIYYKFEEREKREKRGKRP